ncbi:hypothetical protein BU16DRAFT_459572 [Lophium mytilinum]|uniref:Uncharacterized protein n=1 Tax=Lophium mytilinum TaxID=390894 RepID=A0A6A6QUQ9_9PEZI|nr:hypothetical protein BU16DRAFT_459572 [Lophium mytilinum]
MAESEVQGAKQADDSPIHRDVILAIQDPYMSQIFDGSKTYEFRKYLITPTVERIWFYRTSPHSSIEYVCEIDPARTRKPGDEPLPEDGLGNFEFNSGHKDWDGYDYAYKINAVCKLKIPIKLEDLKNEHDIKAAPRGLVYAPKSMTDIDWRGSTRIRSLDDTSG